MLGDIKGESTAVGLAAMVTVGLDLRGHREQSDPRRVEDCAATLELESNDRAFSLARQGTVLVTHGP